MPNAAGLPPDVVTRKEAAAILGVSRKRVTNMRSAGELTPGWPLVAAGLGLFWRHEVEAEAARRAEQRAAAEAKAVRPPPPLPELPPGQEATLEELMAAARWSPHDPGDFVDTNEAARILGITTVQIHRLARAGRLPWLPTGHQSGGRANRVYRRAQGEVIARGRWQHQRGNTSAQGGTA